MGKLLILGLLAGLGWLALSASARREAAELARDASDWVMMFLLRSTSGFASDVPETVLREERERRLRWR